MSRRRPREADVERRGVIEVVDDTNLEALAAGRPTVGDLWAPWCRPCLLFRPMFEVVAGRREDKVRFGACNVNHNPETAMRLQVRSIPTVVAFGLDGGEVGTPRRPPLEGSPGGPEDRRVEQAMAFGVSTVRPSEYASALVGRMPEPTWAPSS